MKAMIPGNVLLNFCEFYKFQEQYGYMKGHEVLFIH
jgi:hypothetical protein